MMNETQSSDNNNNNNECFQGDFYTENLENSDWDTPCIILEDLNWRVEKLRLEEANKKRFLKSGPRFLPYQECRKWVTAMARWDNQEEWQEWIEMGEKRNSYIPNDPETYYGKLGKWISWDHFLGKVELPDDPDDE